MANGRVSKAVHSHVLEPTTSIFQVQILEFLLSQLPGEHHILFLKAQNQLCFARYQGCSKTLDPMMTCDLRHNEVRGFSGLLMDPN